MRGRGRWGRGRGERRGWGMGDGVNDSLCGANLGNNGCCGDMGKAFRCFC